MTIRTYIHSSHKRVESSALLDCGATENFMSMDYAKWLRLPIKRLQAPRPLFNVDGMSPLRYESCQGGQRLDSRDVTSPGRGEVEERGRGTQRDARGKRKGGK